MQSIQPKHSDFKGYPDTIKERTYTKTQGFQRNNCGSGQVGSVVNYSKTYTVTGTQEDLDNAVAADSATFNAEGQANANSNGTCSTACVAVYNTTRNQSNSIPYAMNNTTRYYYHHDTLPKRGHQGVTSPYTSSTNRQSYHKAFLDTTYNAHNPEFITQIAHPPLIDANAIIFAPKHKGLADFDLWSHYSEGGANNCTTGNFYATLVNGCMRYVVTNFPSILGFKNGVFSVRSVDYIQGIVRFEVHFTEEYSTTPIKIGEFYNKTNDYYFSALENYINFAVDGAGYVYIAVITPRKGNLSRGNLGVWRTNYCRSDFETHSFTNIYAWNYSNRHPHLRGFVGNTSGIGAMLLVGERNDSNNDKVSYMGFNYSGASSGDLENISRSLSSKIIANPQDNRAYYFRNGQAPSRAFNWSTKTWQTL